MSTRRSTRQITNIVIMAALLTAAGLLMSCNAKEKQVQEIQKTPALVSEVQALAAQTTCPVMGNPIDKTIFADYNGKRVYFCCGMCPAEFKKDPEKYIKKLADMGQTVETIETGK